MKQRNILVALRERSVALQLSSMLRHAGYKAVIPRIIGTSTLRRSADLVILDASFAGKIIDLGDLAGRPVVYCASSSELKKLLPQQLPQPFFYLPKPPDTDTVLGVVKIALHHFAQISKAGKADIPAVSALRHLGDGVISVDRTGIVTFLNDAALRMTGLPEGKAIGRKIEIVLPLEEETGKRTATTSYSGIIGKGKTIQRTGLVIALPGKRVRKCIDLTAVPIRNGRRLEGTVISIREVAQRSDADKTSEKNDRRFRVLAEKGFEAIAILTEDGTIQYVTAGLLGMLGYTRRDVIGTNAVDYTHPDESGTIEKIIAAILRHPARPFSSRMRCRHKTGGWVWVELFGTNLLSDPDIDGIVMDFRDITVQVEAEEKLNHVNRRLDLIARVSAQLIGSRPIQQQVTAMAEQVRSAFNVETVVVRTIQGDSSFLMTVVGMDENMFTRVLPVRYGLSGYIASSRHAIAIPDLREKESEIYDRQPDVEDKTRKFFRSVAGAPLQMGHSVIGSIAVYTHTKRRNFSRMDLDHLQVIANHIAIAIANNQLFREIREQNIEMTKHIEEQNRAEKMLRESEERYRTLVEYSPDAIAVHVKGIVRFVNNAAVQLIGAPSAEQLIGTSIIEYVHPDYRTAAIERVNRVYSNEPVPSMEQKWVRADGTLVDVEVISIPFLYEGQVAAQIIARNITARKQAETALRESELRFRSLFENSKDAVFIFDTKTGVIIDANAEAEQLLHRKRIEIIGMHQTQMHPADKVDEALLMYRNQILILDNDPVEFEVVNAFGQIVPVEIKASVIRLDKNRIVVQGIFRDITEQKKSERILREKEERYRAFVEQSSEGIYRVAFDEPIPRTLPVDEQVRLMSERSYIVECNEVFARMYGFTSVEQAIGVRVTSHVLPNDPMNIEFRREFIRQGYRLFDRQSRELDIHGKPKYFLNNIIGVFEQDRWIGIWGTQRDITDRRMAEEALRTSEEKYRALFEGSKDGIYISTEDGKFIDANPALVEMLGYSSKEELMALDIPTQVYFNPSDREKFKQSVATQSYVRDLEVSLRRKDGTEVNVLLTALVEQVPGRSVPQYSGTIRDVTERKRLEAQLIQAQKLESIGTLAGGIAHDFNNLLAMILGIAELLKLKAKDNEAIVSYVDKIIDASERGASISKQLLLFARPEQAELRPVAVPKIIGDVQDFLVHFLPKNITVSVVGSDPAAMILGDPGHLHQAVVNLAINARDAMPDGGTLTIATRRCTGADARRAFPAAEDRDHICISVGDTGSGMENSVKRRIFEPFYSTKAKGKGTGLGLSIVHGIVKLHRGHVDVQSEIGKGTIFTLYFPLVSAPPKQSHDEKETMQTNHETILVVDDEQILREILLESLKDEGYTILTASDGNEAIRVFRENIGSIDLVITDLGMPNMGGEELFERLKGIKSDVKVIVSSGFLDSSTKSDLLRKGIKDILAKPYKFDVIFTTIRRVIDAK